jgi:hypothetical protein
MKDTTAVGRPAGKPYATPQLVEYGHIEKLTKGATGLNNDHGTKQP